MLMNHLKSPYHFQIQVYISLSIEFLIICHTHVVILLVSILNILISTDLLPIPVRIQISVTPSDDSFFVTLLFNVSVGLSSWVTTSGERIFVRARRRLQRKKIV